MKKVKLFLASSNELKADREKFEIFLNRKNKKWVDAGLFLELTIWEDFLDAMSQTRLQDEYNKAVRESDIFVMLFFTKVGKYTHEEFATAFGQFKETKRPYIFTYFKDAKISTKSLIESKEDILGLFDFHDKLDTLGHFFTPYTSMADLQLHFNGQLDRLKPELSADLKDKKTGAYHLNDLKKLIENGEVKKGMLELRSTIKNKLYELSSKEGLDNHFKSPVDELRKLNDANFIQKDVYIKLEEALAITGNSLHNIAVSKKDAIYALDKAIPGLDYLDQKLVGNGQLTFVLTNPKNVAYSYLLKSAEGKTMMTGERYATKTIAGFSIKSVKVVAAEDFRYNRYKAKNGKDHFTLKTNNGQIVGFGGPFDDEDQMEASIKFIKENAPTAEIVDETDA